MCKRTHVGTYLTMNAFRIMHSHSFFRFLLLLSAIFSIEKWSFFFMI